MAAADGVYLCAGSARECVGSRHWGANPWPFGPYPNGVPSLLTTRDALRYATMNGAKALRLDSKVGSLTPGKEADIVLIRADDINTLPLGNAFDTVVQQANTENVDTVLIAGKVISGGASSWAWICASTGKWCTRRGSTCSTSADSSSTSSLRHRDQAVERGFNLDILA